MSHDPSFSETSRMGLSSAEGTPVGPCDITARARERTRRDGRERRVRRVFVSFERARRSGERPCDGGDEG